jgi:Fur family ferric uptake transcriptional regulator
VQDLLIDAYALLKKEGYRLTDVRKKLIESILSSNGHWTIQEIAGDIQRHLPGVGVATIYRTVHLLSEHGLLTETKMAGNAARYEVAPTEHHDHLTCRQCGEIFEFENEEIERLQEQVAKALKFELIDHRMELYGDCVRKNCPNQDAKHKSKK